MIPKNSGRRPAISSPRSQRPRLVHWMLADYHHSSGANASAHDRFPDHHPKNLGARSMPASFIRSLAKVCSTAVRSLSASARNLPSSSAKLDRRPHQPQPDPSTSGSHRSAEGGLRANRGYFQSDRPIGIQTTRPARLRTPQAPLTGLAAWSGHSSSKLRKAHSRRAGIPASAWVFAHRKS